MSISFNEIYTKAIALFDDPKITKAYKTNKVQFNKIMYTYLQNAIALFTNPASIGIRLSQYLEPEGLLEVYNEPGEQTTFIVDPQIDLAKENCIYTYIQDNQYIEGSIDVVNGTVTFVPVDSESGIKQFAFEQYFVGEFSDDFKNFNSHTTAGDKLIIGEIKDILARLLVKAWAEEERNLLLDIRNLMQDSDFKITGNDRVLKAKDQWVDQLDDEILQLQTKLAWNIRFMNGSKRIGRG